MKLYRITKKTVYGQICQQLFSESIINNQHIQNKWAKRQPLQSYNIRQFQMNMISMHKTSHCQELFLSLQRAGERIDPHSDAILFCRGPLRQPLPRRSNLYRSFLSADNAPSWIPVTSNPALAVVCADGIHTTWQSQRSLFFLWVCLFVVHFSPLHLLLCLSNIMLLCHLLCTIRSTPFHYSVAVNGHSSALYIAKSKNQHFSLTYNRNFTSKVWSPWDLNLDLVSFTNMINSEIIEDTNKPSNRQRN